MTEETLFSAVLEQPPANREHFLQEACGTDAALFQRLKALVAAHEKAAGILDQPLEPAVAPEPLTSAPAEERIGTLVAERYKLLEQIGEGGMGTVWVAEQTQPVRRKVAIKLIKTGMDSKTVLSRFEAERQALALMDHPNIAKVLDGGTTGSGRPFFVMEYVKGVPLTKYCDDSRLSVAERLALFVPVCHAVQHAHQKGIIHRDLKPSNILVCLYDSRPVPKVIDFGLAKAMHQPLTEHTLHTAHGLIIGTPLYMSPEQAELNNLDVDTRTDVYALGVILYELLTGTTPLEKKRFREAAWQEMLRLIKEEEPPRPSERLSSSGSLPTLAAQRKLEPAKLTRLVRGELDWIVMKALEKDRTRRYETANNFGSDIERYLADERVEACPPSRGYRLRKFVRKNRTALAMAATILMLFVAGAAISTWQAIRAMQAEADAKDKEGLAKKNEQVALDQGKEAQRQAQIARDNEAKANKAAHEKDVALKQAMEDRNNLRHTLSLDRILLAQGAFDNGDVALGREWLEQVPPELRRWEWHYLERQFQGGIFTFQEHTYGVNGLAFSPDGTRLVTSSVDKVVNVGSPPAGSTTAKIWDARTGSPLFELTGHSKPVISVAFSADGRRVVSGSEDKTARVWDALTGKSLLELKGHLLGVSSVAFSPDGTRIVTGSPDTTAKVWDARTGALLHELKGHMLQVWGVAFSPDGKRIVTGSSDKTAKIWDATIGKHLLDLRGHTSYVNTVAFSPDGTQIVTGSADGTARIWDARTGSALLEFKGHAGQVFCVAFSPDGKRVVTGSWDNTAKVWDARTGKSLLDLKHSRGVFSVAFSPDGMRLATGTLTVWDAHSGTPVLELKEPNGAVWCLAFSPDGNRVATGSADKTARVWDAHTGVPLLQLRGHTSGVTSVAFSPDGRRVATGSTDKKAKVWDAGTGESLFDLNGHSNFVVDVAFSPDGSRIATGGYDQTAKIWDAASGAHLFDLKGHTGQLATVVFSPDGTRLATGSWDKMAKIWDSRTGRHLLDLKGHTGQVNSVAFSPDGTRLVTCSGDETVKVWEASTGMLLLGLKGGGFWSVGFSPDGTRLVTGSVDSMAKVWDARTGTPLLAFKGRKGSARVAFSADGALLAIASGTTVKILGGSPTRTADGALSVTERENRKFWTRPRPDLHWEEYNSAINEKNSFAASFHLDRLLTHYKEAITLNPRDVQSHSDLGKALLEKNDVDGAVAQLRQAIELDPKLIEAQKNLARALTDKRDWGEASAVYHRVLALDPTDNDARMILLLKREYQPRDNADRLDLVTLCVSQHRYVFAARLYTEAFAADQNLANSMKPAHCYNAACYAALAGSGQGREAERLDQNERAQWRKQALGWLRADLAVCEKELVGAGPEVRVRVRRHLEHWLGDNDLLALRDRGALAKLPAEERKACEKLWADVTALMKSAEWKTK
jgi:WD40 repeat protein/tetratricopeptide (TPR) repeat protein